MSVTIIQQPSAISFAGNPVLLKAYSNLSEKTFLKVCAEVSVNVYRKSALIESVVRRLSIPTQGGEKEVVFNLSDVLQSSLSTVTIERSIPLAENWKPTDSSGHATYTVKLWDEFLDEYCEVVSTEQSLSVTTDRRTAIPGAYTDLQRLSAPEDTEAFLGEFRLLSDKPDFEAVPVKGSVMIPAFASGYDTKSVSLARPDGTVVLLGSVNFYASEISWPKVQLPEKWEEGIYSLWLSSNTDKPSRTVYVVPETPFVTYFEFINGYGAVEGVYTFGRKTHKSKISQERQLMKFSNSFRPSTRYVKRILQKEDNISLSTGPVSREWAKWFVSTFFVAQKCWMYSKEADEMIPVVIECDEELEIFNESEASVVDIPFTVVKCLNV